ncbi:uncharacterized protein [Eurosta solidaginis]|uniref:uncharacterized protein isoform X2 n=1 Tax=Eurosta solidaginis TaxID=178769 RepID=UPI00353165BB
MWRLLAISIIAVMVMNCEARAQKRYATEYTSSNGGNYASAGTGNAASYGGGFDDYDYGYAPDYGFIDPLLFHQQLTEQILANHAAQNHAIVSVFSSGPAMVTAHAALLPNDNRIQQQIAQQQAYFQDANTPNYYDGGAGGGSYGTANRYAPNHSVAAASIGPGGSYQTAYINPENLEIPNISTRFGGPSSPGGYKGVSVSSFSSSSDINGQKTSHRAAQTTINDNGKVTTYRVQS